MLDALRAEIKFKRSRLTHASTEEASRLLALRIARNHAFKRARSFAAYAAINGEIDLWPIIKLGLSLGKACYLPRTRGGTMSFHRYIKSQMLVSNHWGILEPQACAYVACPSAIDMILCPLVAFDAKGNRVGMGGGYYDKCLAGIKSQRNTQRLWGVGYDFQQVDNFAPAKWDIPMDGILTPTRTLKTR